MSTLDAPARILRGALMAVLTLFCAGLAVAQDALPDVMAAEPVAMVMRQGDDNWVDIGNWVLNALWLAEMNGITSKNVDEAKANPSSPEVAKLLGVTPGIGKQLGLDSDDWAYNVIKKYGNAAEFWQRNLGDDSPYKLDRGVNSLFTEGGVFYPLVLD